MSSALVKSHKVVILHPVLLLYISECPHFLFLMLPTVFLQTAQASLWPTATHLYLHPLSPPTHSSPWGDPFIFPPSQYLPRFSNAHDPLLRCALLSSPKTQWSFWHTGFPQPGNSLPLCLLSSLAWPAPSHPSDLAQMSLPQRSLPYSLIPQTCWVVLSYTHMVPYFPLKHLFNYDQISMCGNCGLVPDSLASWKDHRGRERVFLALCSVLRACQGPGT